MATRSKHKTAPATRPAAVSPAAAAAVADEIAGHDISVRPGRPDYIKGAWYVATRPFNYGPPKTAGTPLLSGQVVKLGGFPKDEVLVRLEYLRPLNPKATGEPLPCRACGELFETERARMAHGAQIHDPKENPYLRHLGNLQYQYHPNRLGRPRTDMEQHQLDELGRQAAEWEEKQAETAQVQANQEHPLRLDKTQVAQA